VRGQGRPPSQNTSCRIGSRSKSLKRLGGTGRSDGPDLSGKGEPHDPGTMVLGHRCLCPSRSLT